MALPRLALCAALALCVAAAASAGRTPPRPLSSRAWQRLEQRGGGDVVQWLRAGADADAGGGDEEDRKGKGKTAIIGIKYEVPPSLHPDFIDEWRKLDDATSEEEGNIIFDLKKTMGDNLFFWTYGEWDSYESYMDHLKADHTEDFLDFLADNDITWDLYPLKNVTDNSAAQQQKGASVGRKGKGRGSDDPRDMNAHIVIQYHVPPSKVGEFIDTWQEAAQKTWEEEDNSIYALRRFATNNHHFIAYGTWESYDAYWDHFTSRHVYKLRDFLDANEIIWYAEPLKKLGDQPEGRL